NCLGIHVIPPLLNLTGGSQHKSARSILARMLGESFEASRTPSRPYVRYTERSRNPVDANLKETRRLASDTWGSPPSAPPQTTVLLVRKIKSPLDKECQASRARTSPAVAARWSNVAAASLHRKCRTAIGHKCSRTIARSGHKCGTGQKCSSRAAIPSGGFSRRGADGRAQTALSRSSQTEYWLGERAYRSNELSVASVRTADTGHAR